MFNVLAGIVVFTLAGLGTWFGVERFSEPPPPKAVAKEEISRVDPSVQKEVSQVLQAEPVTVATTSTRFSDTEVEFEKVEDEPVTGAAEPAAPPPIVSGGRIQWSRYWLPFTPEEEQLYGNWKRPDGPIRVGIQAGHWKLGEVPDELSGLKASTGAYGGGTSEQVLVLNIAKKVQELLVAKNIVVDLLPATIPIDYTADAFVSIHADGNNSPSVSGFKIARPRGDFSGKSQSLVDALYDSYSDATGLREDSNITRRMSGYYAFNWRRYDHALHPMTPAAIVETGFVTSPGDREIIASKPDVAAKGIADGILKFLSK